MDDSALLLIWTVYDRPDDYPESIVVRRHAVLPDGAIRVEGLPLLFDTLDGARAFLVHRALVRLARDPNDAPKIVESWI